MTKYIFVTGGVVSSVGKGIAAASIGRILKSLNIPVTIQKLDPYLNVDPGTMSPYQHGEVFVTQDGAETDLDLGNYERFIDNELTTVSSVTTGQIYSSVIAKERRGDFLGGTIQVVPHITNEIKDRIKEVGRQADASVVIAEVGGTVGDIEGLPFLEAVRQMRNDVGKDNVLYIHVTLLPHLSTSGELKTKPTQHSVKELRSIGIQPDIIICRSEKPVPDGIKDKISLFCNVESRAVIPLHNADTIYEIPLMLQEAGIGDLIVEMLKLPKEQTDMQEWADLVDRIKAPKDPVRIALVGKYVELQDAYFSVREALHHAATHHNMEVEILWVHSEDLEKDDNEVEEILQYVQGIIVPGGFGYRGIEGMVRAARYAREHKLPYFGLCLGLHVMVVDYARHVLGSEEPNSTEFVPDTPYPVIDLLPEQCRVEGKGGTMRLGTYPCRLIEGTSAAAAYKQEIVHERHRHRFEFNNDFGYTLEKAGLIASGRLAGGNLVEIVEVRDHPWMLGTQFHPEFKSRPNRPHPLFCEFIRAAKETLREGAQHPLPLQE